MKRTAVGFVALSLCLLCCPASSQEGFKGKGKLKGKGQPAAPAAPSSPTWEYSVLSRPQVAGLGDDLQAGLNKLGEEGWELVAVEAGPGRLYLKRLKRGGQAATSPDARAEAKDVTHVLRLKHAVATELAQTLSQLYRERGLRLAVDARTNSVILAGTEGRMLDLLKLAAELDSEEEHRKEKKSKVEKPSGR